MDIRHTDQKRRLYMTRMLNNQVELQQQYQQQQQQQQQLLLQQQQQQQQHLLEEKQGSNMGGGHIIGNPLEGIDERLEGVASGKKAAKEPLLGSGENSVQQHQRPTNGGR